MTIAAHHGHFIPHRGGEAVVRIARPVAAALIGGLFFVVVVLVFAGSSGILRALGINHGGVTGSVVSKIHPATYLAFATVALIVLARRNPASFFVNLITPRPGTPPSLTPLL